MLNFPKRFVINGTQWNNNPLKFDVNCFQCGTSPSWQDIILSGNTALTLTNAKANSLNYVKLFGVIEQRDSELPIEYQRVEYLESTGTQFIATGLTSYKNTNVLKIKIRPSQVSTTTFITFQNPSSTAENMGLFMASGYLYYQYGIRPRLSTTIVADTDYVIEAGNGYLTVNGTTYTGSEYTEFTVNTTTYIGCSSPYDNRRFKGNIYYYHYEDKDGNLLFDGIPCRRKSDSVLGMYDTVTGNFLTNAGTGTFTAGVDVVPSPETPMDIWCNNGVVKVNSQGQVYTDGTQETVTVSGKNLFDVDNNLLEGYYVNNADGVLKKSTDGSSSCFKDFLPSKPNVTYTMSRIDPTGTTSMRMWAYDKDKNPISSVFNSTVGAIKVTGTTPNGTAYIRCSFGSIPQYSQNVQLELGSTATEYEPYYYGGSANAEMLLKVGDYKDVQSVLNGSVTRNVGIKVLDGTENWTVAGSGNTRFQTPIIDSNKNPSDTIYSTHYSYSSGASGGNTCRISTAGNLLINGEIVQTVEQLKQFLADQYAAGTPVIIVYPLATPTEETVTGQPLTIQAGTNIITAEGSIDNLGLEVSYKASEG